MNVHEATLKRLDRVLADFDNVYVSFSGGKDSGVLLNLCIDHLRANYPGRKLGVFHLDYEAQYEMTTRYVNETLASNADILEIYRVCVPFKVTTCTSMHQNHWRPWQPDLSGMWVSNMPDTCYTAKDFPFFNEKMWDYEFQERFSLWLHEKKGARRTCCLVGIRTQESLHRWRAIHSDRNYRNHEGLIWTRQVYDNVFNAYPIFDWITEDIWTANANFKWTYNRLYDLYYKAGVPIASMRVASPFLSAAQESLKLYRVIEPHTWGKLVSRVNGVNFTGIYGGTTAMGWKSITLPEGHTWKSYMHFLLSTLPEGTRENYLSKLETSMKFWRERGGVLSDKTIRELENSGVNIRIGADSNYNTDKKPVRMEYIDDIDSAEFQLIPTYKRMCICILKNDHLCKYMGFSFTKNENESRKAIINKYRMLL
jgi:predicted phosphoadenosine phosphosulfate sulfurtransferase